MDIVGYTSTGEPIWSAMPELPEGWDEVAQDILDTMDLYDLYGF